MLAHKSDSTTYYHPKTSSRHKTGSQELPLTSSSSRSSKRGSLRSSGAAVVTETLPRLDSAAALAAAGAPMPLENMGGGGMGPISVTAIGGSGSRESENRCSGGAAACDTPGSPRIGSAAEGAGQA